MDAASNNGVDDIRDLRDETAYTPSACQYKVYIIDEVHMLSTAAFNALLKTLEEPPAHVIFILATTEIQKVPATILSRCQRYDFTRIGPEDIAKRVEYIAGQEGLELTGDGAELIARLADGAMRDALSILDTCAGVTAKVDADVVRRMAGVTDRSYLFRISDAIEAQDAAAALAQLAQLRQQSVDVKRLTEELIAHYRALMLAALPGGQTLLSGVSPEEEAQYLEKGPRLGQREAIRAIRTLGNALEHMTRGSDQRIELELALFSLSEPAQQPVYAAAAAPAAQRLPSRRHPVPLRRLRCSPLRANPLRRLRPLRSRSSSRPFRPRSRNRQHPWQRSQQSRLPRRRKVSQPLWRTTRPRCRRSRRSPMQPRCRGTNRPSPPSRCRSKNRLRSRNRNPSRSRRHPLRRTPQTPSSTRPVRWRRRASTPSHSGARWSSCCKKKDPMLYTYLKKSKGYFDGTRVLIDGGKTFRDFIRANKDSQRLIKKLIAQVSGVAVPIGPIRAEECPPPLGQRRGVTAQIGAAGAGRQH